MAHAESPPSMGQQLSSAVRVSTCVRMLVLLEPQPAPPHAGAGAVHVRVRLRMRVRVWFTPQRGGSNGDHADHSPAVHGDHAPSRGQQFSRALRVSVSVTSSLLFPVHVAPGGAHGGTVHVRVRWPVRVRVWFTPHCTGNHCDHSVVYVGTVHSDHSGCSRIGASANSETLSTRKEALLAGSRATSIPSCTLSTLRPWNTSTLRWPSP